MKKSLMILFLLAPAWPASAWADQTQGLLAVNTQINQAGPGGNSVNVQAAEPNEQADGLLLAADTETNQGESPSGQDIGEDQVVPKDQYMAVLFSVIPGLLFHGSGNFYAENYSFGTEMLVMEIIGGGISIWGYNIIHQPQNWGQYFGNDTPQAGYWIKAAGVSLLAVSWVGDIATAAGAADDWNKDHQIDIQMDSFNMTGARLTLATNF